MRKEKGELILEPTASDVQNEDPEVLIEQKKALKRYERKMAQ